jgi:nucleotide-binding universal stress UspA family protein
MDRIKKILAPTDLSDLSCAGLRHALKMGRSLGAEVIVYYVIDLGDQWTVRRHDSGPVRDMVERHRRMLDTFLREKFPAELKGVEVRQVVELGTAAFNIVDKARAEEVDRIVVSTHGRTGLDHFLLGSVSDRVITRAPCPVLVIPARTHKLADVASGVAA